MDRTTFAQSFHDHCSKDPNYRVYNGIEGENDRLPDPTLAWADEQIKCATKLLSDLDQLPASGNSDDAIDDRLARLWLKRQIHELSLTTTEGQRSQTQMPRAVDNLGDNLFVTFFKDPRPAEVRAKEIESRLRDAPRFVADVLKTITAPLPRWTKMEIDKAAAIGDLFSSLAAWCESEAPSVTGMTEAVNIARDAVADYAKQLAEKPSSSIFAIGEEEAEKVVANRGIPHSLTTLQGIARDFLWDTRETIESLRSKLVAKYDLADDMPAAELHRYLNKRFRVDATELNDIIVRYQREKENLDTYLAARDLFPIPSDQEIHILQTPQFMAPSIPAGAMMPPEAFRAGTKKSLVYLTLSEKLMDEHTELSIPNMMIHEGIPGHHLQLSYAAMHPSLIRKHASANDQAEGWTTMLEDYILDLGYMGELADEARFCAKRDISRIGARVVLDLFFMSGDKRFLDIGIPYEKSDDPFACAGSLLTEVTGFVPERAQAELNWYSQERGYPLSYLVGNHGVWQLKRRVEAHLGESGPATDKKFHTAYLEAGSMPVAILAEYFADKGLVART